METNKKTSREPVNPNASPEARKLLEYLYHISGNNILSGQHNPPGHISKHTCHAYEITRGR